MVGGLGLGTLIQSVVTHTLNIKSKNTERLYAEKRETYLGLLDALHQAAVNPSDEKAKA
jgi:pantothenate kinase